MSTPLLEDKCNQGDPSSPRMTLQTFKLTYPCGHKGICSLNIDQELLSETKAFQMPGLSTFCFLCWWHLRLYLKVRLFSEMSDCFWSVRLLSEVSSSVFQHGHSCTHKYENTDTNTQIPNVHLWNVFQCVPAWPPVCSHLPVSGCCCVYSCPLAAVWRHTTGDHRGPTHPSKTLTKLTFLHFNRDSLSWKSSYWQNITVMCCFPNTRSEN